MYLPKHHRGPLQIYYAAMYMFGLESDELVTKGKHRLPSTLTRSAQFGENIGAGGGGRITNKSQNRFAWV